MLGAGLGKLSKWTSGLLIPQKRMIGGIPAQVTISEQERDELQITEHPVEQGAPISDHAYKRPSEVHLRCGWGASVGDVGAQSNRGWYAMLLDLQRSLEPFDLHTGKRSYKDMLIQSLTVTTDSHSEYVLMAEIVCRQVIIVPVTVAKAQTYSDNPDDQKTPQSNASSEDKGSAPARDIGDDQEQKDFGGSPDEEHSASGGWEDGSDVRDPNPNPGYDEAGSDARGPEADKVNSATARNTEAQQNVEKNISLGREERQQGQGTLDILKDRQ